MTPVWPRMPRSMVMAGVAMLTAVSLLPAQGIRIRGVTTTRFLELQRFEDDSVLASTTNPADGPFRTILDGRVVQCFDGETFCRYKRSGAAASAIPVTQDLQFTAWGLGEGLSLHSDVRFRTVGGSAPELWPRANEHVDLLTAYLELDRSHFTLRGGRQFAMNGLGVYNYDGLSLAVRPHRIVAVEAWGGWSLLRGVNGGYTTSAFAAVEELPPDRPALLLGTSVRVRPTRSSAFRVLYQREIRENRSGLYSERVAADGSMLLGPGSLDVLYQHDLASGQTNEALARYRLPLPHELDAVVELRHFRPFFELWTIWGAFSPVGFDEVRTGAGWSTADRRFTVDANWAFRHWDEANVGLTFQPLRQTGWRAGADVTWRPATRWLSSAHYSADVGAGASNTQADVGVRYEMGRRAYIGTTLSGFQSLYEYRVGTGQIFGLGMDAGIWVTPVVRVVADAAVYRQERGSQAPFTNWNQRRAALRLEWTLGGDPGARPTTGGRP